MRLSVLLHLSVALCSIGDNLSEFRECISLCNAYRCQQKSVFTSKLTNADFTPNSVHTPFKQLFAWDCPSDCNYKCQQIITNNRQKNGLPKVKFNGKWPFKRVWGITELASVIFSLLNLRVNYTNYKKIWFQYRKTNDEMYLSYTYLLLVSMIGWIFSTIFHIRDLVITEILDYYGACLIIIGNFYVITARYFNLKGKQLLMFQVVVMVMYFGHMFKMYIKWDYNYNIIYNMILGLCSMSLWILHSAGIARVYTENYYVLNNSITLLPYETKILTKLNPLQLSRPKIIPYIPIVLNLWMLVAMGFEVWEFEPIWNLIDSHSLWHLLSYFPQLIWYDWNIWDVEVNRILATKAF